ncbi:hypothetical protein DU490_11585 [Halomonas sp. DQ26W]|nr:hypothetical protein DU490_11585 [Halomonas sp. DQ26W]
MMTIQIRETIYYQGEKLDIVGYPPLPKKDPRVIYIEGRRVDSILDLTNTTMCWRRYIGTWRIEDKKLYLCHLEGWYQMTTSEPILAEWFSGILTLDTYQDNKAVNLFEVEITKGYVVSEKRLQQP